MTVTAGPVYYSPWPAIDNEICGSVYDVNNTYLVDFPVAQPSGQGSTSGSEVLLQGLGSSENVVFNLHYPANSFCNGGWNAYPLPSNVFEFSGAASSPTFGISADPSDLQVVTGQRGSVEVTVTPDNGFSGSVTFTAVGFPPALTTPSLPRVRAQERRSPSRQPGGRCQGPIPYLSLERPVLLLSRPR